MLTKPLVFAASFLLSLTTAAPATAPVTDATILQYALTLEHLEAAFYKEALAKFTDKDFKDCGVERSLFEQIAMHEATHVQVLQSALGSSATQACKYSFPYTDVHGFKALAQILEGVGVTAYLGAAKYLSDKFLLTAAGSILTTEARHAAWLATTNDRDPWNGAFDSPLDFSQVFTLAAAFIVSCPATNPALPVKRFPTLTLASPANGSIKPDSTLTFTVPHDFKYDTSQCLNIVFISGLGSVVVPYSVNGTVTVPKEAVGTGTIYAILTSSNTSVADTDTLAGPAVVIFDGNYPTVSHSGDAEDCSVPGSGSGSGSGSGAGSGAGTGSGAGSGSGGGSGGGCILGIICL